MFSCRQIRQTRTKTIQNFKSFKGFVEQPLTFLNFKNLEILGLFVSSLKLFIEKKVESFKVML